MKQLYKAVVATSIGVCASAAFASPVSLGTIQHLYGTDANRQLSSISSVFHPGGNCDTPNAATITVRATAAATCNRFADAFDFSSIAFDSIDRFEITLDFTGARNQQGLFSSERWNVRGASNYEQSATTFGNQLNGGGTQTFVFNSSAALFGDIVNAETFMLSFSSNSNSNNFNLSSARLEIFGVSALASVPEPGTLALVGAALLGLAFSRRRHS